MSKCRLRRFQQEDAPCLTRIADDIEIAKWLRDSFPSPYTMENARAFLAVCEKEEETQLCRAIEVEESLAGCITVVPREDMYRKTGEIGYWLAKEYWGRGIMTEAVKSATAEAMRRFGLCRIEAEVLAENEASARVLEKAGYVREGRKRKSIYRDGALWDSLLYAYVGEDAKAKTEKEKMLAGERYFPGEEELCTLRARAHQLAERYNRTTDADFEERDALIRQMFQKVGKEPWIMPEFHYDYGNIEVGDFFFANYGCVILDCAPVRIGDYCLIGPQVGIYTAIHPMDPMERSTLYETAAPVTIGDHCWIGGHATINPGVTLGNNVVVASGAVVTRSFGDNVVIGGVPARVIRENPPKDGTERK